MEHEITNFGFTYGQTVTNFGLTYRRPKMPLRNKLVSEEKKYTDEELFTPEELKLMREARELLDRMDAYLEELEGPETK